MTGTIINALTVVIGGTLGTLLGHRFPQRMQETILAGLGLFTLVIAIDSALVTRNPLIVLGSLLVGVLIGEALRLENRLEDFGRWLKVKLVKDQDPGSTARFIEGFVTASLIFCVGPLTIQGAIEDGLIGDSTKLIIKAMMDGFAALAFATTLGPGVIASVIVILFFQGGISLLANLSSNVFTEPMILEMTATGGVVLLAIGFRLLEIKRIRAANLLPAIFIAPISVAVMDVLGITYYPNI
ncbi:MAG: DUF554 domain-containing protein [Candidatus Promineifilaceae bacterium]|nr:DUF554 domain-containing protein [Candidatus Promineifilaceae bacterium]